MAPTHEDLCVAIDAYWAKREEQRSTAEASSSTAEGTAKSVRGGGHFNPIANLLAQFFRDAGFPVDSIAAAGRNTTLPGYFRPNKAWDLVVAHQGVLVAAIELKALGSGSSGKNFNNRIEEALGNAVDLSHATTNGLVGEERPWLGYFFLLEDSEDAHGKRRSREHPELPLEDAWQDLSLEQRFAKGGVRLVEERLYDAVCFLSSSAETPGPREPEERLDWRHFSAAIQARISYLAKLGIP